MVVRLGLLAVSLLALAGCNSDRQEDVETSIGVKTDFSQGAEGWIAGLSDLPPGSEEDFDFEAEVKALPSDPSKFGFYLASHNRSDDVFMFLKKKLEGLRPDTDYAVSLEVTFLSNAGVGCMGIGGSPGESVYIKVGGSDIEPIQADYYLNLDIGSQSESGNDAIVIGNAATEGAECGNESLFAEKTLTTPSESRFVFTSSDEGEGWLFIGSDSGFEGLSQFYYTQMTFTLSLAGAQ